jgi:hypothetical protein
MRINQCQCTVSLNNSAALTDAWPGPEPPLGVALEDFGPPTPPDKHEHDEAARVRYFVIVTQVVEVATVVLLTFTMIVIRTTDPTAHDEDDFRLAWKKPLVSS